ncbi:MAG: hypothetical protein H6814_11000 [Phycisphaeraceae bacterium]|nr:hypothetical protein [Phycisphaeraceae bacterium]
MLELLDFIIGVLVGLAAATPAIFVWRKRLLRRARAAIRKALTDQRLSEIGSLSQGLAHEIKNPLSTIGLNAQLLIEHAETLPIDEDEREPLVRRLGALSRETQRLGGIVEDFLNYAGEIRVEPRPINLNELISELTDFYSPQAQSKGVRLRTDLDASLPRCLADPSALKQALLNLMINATDAMERNAEGAERRLTISTRRARSEEGDPVCRVRVEDTGPGVKPENLARIFQPYFTTRKGGAGLGLAITKRLIEEQAGTIDSTPNEGPGAAFEVSLPEA